MTDTTTEALETAEERLAGNAAAQWKQWCETRRQLRTVRKEIRAQKRQMRRAKKEAKRLARRAAN